MICPTCNKETGRLKAFFDRDGNFKEYCADCLGISEAGGARTDGIITRNSLRVRTMSVKHEGDTLPPHIYNKVTRRLEPNPEFVKQFGASADQFFTEKEVEKVAMPKLAEHFKKVKEKKAYVKDNRGVTFSGKKEAGMKRVLDTN